MCGVAAVVCVSILRHIFYENGNMSKTVRRMLRCSFETDVNVKWNERQLHQFLLLPHCVPFLLLCDWN
jgi:hypothetical protein